MKQTTVKGKQHRWTSTHYTEWKSLRLKSIWHVISFIQSSRTSTQGDKSEQCLSLRGDTEDCLGRDMLKFSGVIATFYIFMKVWVMHVYDLSKLKKWYIWVLYILTILFQKRNSTYWTLASYIQANHLGVKYMDISNLFWNASKK